MSQPAWLRSRARLMVAAVVALTLAASALLGIVVAHPSGASGLAVFEGPVSRAACGPGSMPETALQGEVPRADRDSSRNRGYRCNLELLGHYQGEGASWVNPSYGLCAYAATQFPSRAKSLWRCPPDGASDRWRWSARRTEAKVSPGMARFSASTEARRDLLT